MKRILCFTTVILVLIAFLACNGSDSESGLSKTQNNVDNPSPVGDEALIKEAISSYVASKGIALENMKMTFSDLVINGKEASVEVTFGLKGNPESSHVKTYNLTRESGLWEVVVPEPAAGGAPHGMMGMTGEGMANPHGGDAMPEGHPVVEEMKDTVKEKAEEVIENVKETAKEKKEEVVDKAKEIIN